MDRLFDVVAIFSLVLIVWVLSSVRRAHIRVEYSVSWLLAGAVLLMLARWRTLDDWIAAALGISDSFIALAMIAGAAFLVVLYRLSLRISGLKDSSITLAQQVAILEFRLEALSEKKKTLNEEIQTPARAEKAAAAETPKPKRAWWPWAAALAGLILVIEVYGPALSGAFVLDDRYLPFMDPNAAQIAAAELDHGLAAASVFQLLAEFPSRAEPSRTGTT